MYNGTNENYQEFVMKKLFNKDWNEKQSAKLGLILNIVS